MSEVPYSYQPEMLTVEKDTVYAAIKSIEDGLESIRECLKDHEAMLGRKSYAEVMKEQIRHSEKTLATLRAL